MVLDIFSGINFFDPATWLWGAALIIVATFILIFFRLFLGKKEPF